MSYADKMIEIQKGLDVKKAAREKRDEDEIDKIAPYFADDTHVVVRVPDAAVKFPGHLVGTRPMGPAYERFKQILWKDSTQRGVAEAKSRAGGELARHCLVYPSAEVYDSMVAEYAFLPDKFAEALIEAARAGAEAEGKG